MILFIQQSFMVENMHATVQRQSKEKCHESTCICDATLYQGLPYIQNSVQRNMAICCRRDVLMQKKKPDNCSNRYGTAVIRNETITGQMRLLSGEYDFDEARVKAIPRR